jgi:hypothetical protein
MAIPLQVEPYSGNGGQGQTSGTQPSPQSPATGVPQPSTTTTSGTGTSPGNGTPTQQQRPRSPLPGIVKNFQIKEKILRPSLTSHFQCWFNPPDAVRKGAAGQYYMDGGELLSLSCSEASLPGSSIITNEINDDYTGITERLGYRRQYDDRSDFTFYVDHGRQNGSYNVIMFFEEWIRYVAGESSDDVSSEYHYRVNFPDGETGYRTNIFINKFERDFAGNYLQYNFIQAYPTSITSMPVSYDSSEILKCTVSFTYNRYVIDRYANAITDREFESAIDAGVAAAYGTAAGSAIAQELLNINKASGGPVEVKSKPASIPLQQKIRTGRLGL